MSFFAFQRVAEGYANHRPYYHPLVTNRIRQHLDLKGKCSRALDVGCGTGLSTIALKDLADNVTGIDGSEEMIAVANTYRDEQITYHHAPAEKLPFEDFSFDAAASTFGIMFASNQEAAISELARVVRPGGRVAIAAWLPDSTAVKLRQVVAPFVPPPPQQASPPPSPFNWGDPAWLQDALGEHFELGFEAGELTHRASSAEETWEIYKEGFGPIRATAQALDDEQRSELKSAFVNWLDDFNTGLGTALTYQYLVTVGTRK